MIVTFENLRPDMVLAADVLDAAGRMLLPRGTTLTDRHLRYCQMWGILTVDVVGEGADHVEGPALDPAHLAEADATLRPRFRHADLGDAVVATLFDHVVREYAKRLAAAS